MSIRSATAAKRITPKPIKELVRVSCRRVGEASGRLRVDPGFLIVGTKRGGTTSLWNYLVRHPLVVPMFPATENLKSAHYFDENFTRPYSWYRGHFPTKAYMAALERRYGTPPVTGEASPLYMWDLRVPERVARSLPGVKVVMLLREPVSRAYSHYNERVGQGVEPLDFADALRAEPTRLRGELERMRATPGYYSRAYDYYAYRSRGVYLPQVREWYRMLPAEQVLVVRSEDLYTDARALVRRVADFLGLPRYDVPVGTRHNHLPTAPMPADVAAELAEFYRPHNAALYDFLGTAPLWDT